MVDVDLDPSGLGREELAERLRGELERIDPEAVVRVRIVGEVEESAAGVLGASSVRAMAPSSMTVSVSFPRARKPEIGT
jgi:hypothetical protein